MAAEINPIGYFQSSKKYPFDAARQAVFDQSESTGHLELLPGQNFEQALQGLEGFSHVWVIYQFHLNPHWNPIVQPPRGEKQGVFATRSPHRPNQIGISVLELDRIEGRKIFFKNHDLLDGSPILDLKPYLPASDSFSEARTGWVATQSPEIFEVTFSIRASEQLDFLQKSGITEFQNFLQQQLGAEPLNHLKKRIFPWQNKFIIAYRTWRALFEIKDQKVEIQVLFSGYSPEDLEKEEDKYQDKNLHRAFLLDFPSRDDLPRFKAE